MPGGHVYEFQHRQDDLATMVGNAVQQKISPLPRSGVPAAFSDPEMALVTACARVCLGAQEQTRLRPLLRDDLDWPRVVHIAATHRVSLLLYHTLKACDAGTVPPAVMQELRAGATGAARHGLRLTGELVTILTLFGDHGIKALPFKGPAVAYSLYGGLGLREFGDLDILVHEADIAKATALLVERGYYAPDQMADTVNRPFLQFQPFLESPQSQGVFNLYRPDGVVVELHWRFTPRHFPFPLAESDLWDRLASVDLPGLKAPSLSPEDMLLLLCVHGSKHCWERLAWICDVAELVRAMPEIDWTAALARARRLRVTRIVHVGLLLASDVLGADVPPALLQDARRDREAVRLAAWVQGRLSRRPLKPFGETEEYRFVFNVRDTLRERLRYSFHLLATPAEEDWEFLRLPGTLAALYYLIRPVRLTLAFFQRRLLKSKAA